MAQPQWRRYGRRKGKGVNCDAKVTLANRIAALEDTEFGRRPEDTAYTHLLNCMSLIFDVVSVKDKYTKNSGFSDENI